MSKYTVTVKSDFTSLLFTDAKGKTQALDTIDGQKPETAINTVFDAAKRQDSVTGACLSLIIQILDNPRFDEFKGKGDIEKPTSKLLKEAFAEGIIGTMKPLFMEHCTIPAGENKESAWTETISKLKSGGNWSSIQSTALRYFNVVGKLPCAYDGANPHKAKVLPVNVMQKVLSNLSAPTPHTGIAGRLIEIALEVEKHNEKTEWGDIPGGIASLKSMLAVFEGLHREALERATEQANLKMTPEQRDALNKSTADALAKRQEDERNIDAMLTPIAPSAKAMAQEATRRAQKNKGKVMDAQEVKNTPALM